MAKRVHCTHCEGVVAVGGRAISVVCPHCNKRLVVGDVLVDKYRAVRKVATCGDIVVASRGHLVASVKAENLTVNGKLRGDVFVRGRVAIESTGSLTGDVEAPLLRVESGGLLNGIVRIGDKQPPKTAV